MCRRNMHHNCFIEFPVVKHAEEWEPATIIPTLIGKFLSKEEFFMFKWTISIHRQSKYHPAIMRPQ